MNTNTKILETLEKEIAENTRYTGYEGLFSKTIEMLRANIREESAKQNGAKKPYKIIEKLLKSEPCKYNNAMQKAHPSANGYGFLDGYRVFFSDDTFGYEVAEEQNRFRMLDNFKPAEGYTSIDINVEDLKYYIKVAKPRGKYGKYDPFIIETPDGIAGYNPLYLLDLIEYTGSNTIKYYGNKEPIYADNGKALLLPVNVSYSNTTYQEYRAKWFNEKQEGREAA